MKTQKPDPDRLDAWLRDQPVSVSADFTRRTLQRIHADPAGVDKDMESILDALFKIPVCPPGEDFAEKTLQQVANGRTVAGMPVWTVTLVGMAAALMLGILAFAALFQQAYRDQNLAAQQAPVPIVADSEVLFAATERSSEPIAGAHSIEDIITMEIALQELAGLNEVETGQILAVLMR